MTNTNNTDYDGHVTTYAVGTDTAGNAGDPDANVGDRGQVLWVQDAGYADSNNFGQPEAQCESASGGKSGTMLAW